ncbi:MAG TPA: hypothetical protein VE010_24250 [Thermoanaerobaculia bacterium]|nr:hypothetical protein [Thermoanaerobaculia bacterium]
MYWLYGIDTVVRIAAALVLLFVCIPALAWPRPASFTRLDWFFWNFGVGLTLLTLAGQLFTLLNVASAVTYVLLFATIIVLCRARRAGVPPLHWLRDAYRDAVLYGLRILDRGREAIVPRTFSWRGPQGAQREGLSVASMAAWGAILLTASITRLYRPFATANLGFSDTYVHLYLMRLLDQGRQVDPAWGPYPRGMHFLLLPIERLTNVDAILLMNFFGAFSGILLTLSAAYVAHRIARHTAAALVAGLLFATMIGGASQYFALGGSVSGPSAIDAREKLSRSYAEMADSGEFDVLLTAFQRQTSTLPQELAIVLLLPGALFLIDWLRTRDKWRLTGFVGCTAAIAAVHSGVAVPLVALCAAAAFAALLCRVTTLRDVLRGAGAGAIGIAIGSTWMLGFLRYRSIGASDGVNVGRNVGGTALYYFPFLRSFAGDATGEETAYMMLTPFLIAIVIVAIIVAIAAIRLREPAALWISGGTIFFVITHAASVLGIPEIVEVRRNATWLALTIAVLLGIAVAAIAARLPRRAYAIAPALAIVLWVSTTPNLYSDAMRARLLDYSGYGTTAYAVLRISQRHEPFTWTLVSYGQEYPMVLGRGFHLNGVDFLEQFDPAESPLRIPTPHVFIAVEKTPHHFQINNWSTRFDRASVEERLQTWCMVYGLTHRDIRVFLDDENVRIYEIRKGAGRA